MLRRTVVLLSTKKPGRKIVRDPRQQRVPSVRTSVPAEVQQQTLQEVPQQQQQPMVFEPTSQNQQSVGSTLGSYALAGGGMAIGFSIVGAIFGVF
jgi:preprotein translocase subunit SecF